MAVYIMEAVGLDLAKIGFAADPWLRLSKVRSDCPVPVEIVALMDGSAELEGELHARFADHRKNREWFHYAQPLREFIASLPAVVPPRRRRRLGGALGDWLIRHDLTQVQFAEKIGTTHATVSRICSGKQLPSVNLLIAIARATGGEVTPNDLIDWGVS